jgi:hypothetical protein
MFKFMNEGEVVEIALPLLLVLSYLKS